MRTRLALVCVVAAACGRGGWHPTVVGDLAASDETTEVSAPFQDGQDGTELVLAVLGQAKAIESEGLSNVTIQVGGCAREVATHPSSDQVPQAHGPELDAIVLRAKETQLHCRRHVEQEIIHGSDGSSAGGFGDPVLVVKQQCDPRPIEHDVVRYRYEVEHGFITPDWDEIERVTGVRLAFGSPHCGLPGGNQVSARLHPHRANDRPRPQRVASSAGEMIELVRRARDRADARDVDAAAAFAEQALARVRPDQLVADDATVDAIAAAHFYAIERDVGRFLARATPEALDDTWAADVGAEIDRIAARYEAMRDRVRHPAIAKWLRAGAGKVAALHAHVADVLAGAGQARAADLEREKARQLASIAGQSN